MNMAEDRYDKTPEEIKKGWFSRKLTSCFGCLVFLAIFFIVLFLLGSIALAKTGLVEIPVISNIFYEKPRPSRVVEVSDEEVENIYMNVQRDMENRMKSLLMDRVMNAKFDLAQQEFKIDQNPVRINLLFTEKDLTAIMKKGLAGRKDMPVSDMQIAILPEEMEIFMELEQPVKGILTVNVVPRAEDGKLDLKIRKARLGNMPIPAFLLDLFTNNILKSKIDELNDQLFMGANLETLQLSDGKVEMTGLLTKLPEM